MVLQHDVHTQGVDWQAITDMTIQQYSQRLRSGLLSLYYNTTTISGGCTNMGTIH